MSEWIDPLSNKGNNYSRLPVLLCVVFIFLISIAVTYLINQSDFKTKISIFFIIAIILTILGSMSILWINRENKELDEYKNLI